MRVTSLGHAGLKVETTGGTLVIDPWFSPEGAFQASWFQFPDNKHLMKDGGLLDPACVIISHEHMDHVDPWFLARVHPSVPAIIHQYPSPALQRKILSAGSRQVIAIPAWEQYDFMPGGYVFFVPEESPANHDAAIVIHADGYTLLNLNDARLSPAQFRQIRAQVGGTIDFFSLQGAGASWYPICYKFPNVRRMQLSRKKRLAKFAYVARAIKIVDPKVVFPFAGPPCFLDPDLFHHNNEMEAGIFPDQQQVADWLAHRAISNSVVLLPGDAWDLDSQTKDVDPAWTDFTLADREPYLQAYAERRRPFLDAVLARYADPTESLWVSFRDYFERLLSLSTYFNRKISMRVGFDITGPGGGQWSVDFRSGLEGAYDTLGNTSYQYTFASKWLPPLLSGDVPWEDFFLSLRFEVSRDPDLYNDHLLGLLKFAERKSLKAVERFETSMQVDERIVVHAEGRSYRIQRLCPHAGNDLLTAEILPGRIIRCLAHHYEFALDTGECVNGTCPPLATERLK